MTRPDFLDDGDLRAVWNALPQARVVGGAIRDALIGRPVADIDLATPCRPEAVTEALTAAGLRVIPTGLDHGTVTALSGARGFEVTTLRRDVATDGRHATVAFTDDWRDDAARRDFTFNAMSMRRDGTVFDPFDGAADLAAGVVRFVGEPARRIAEDFLRVLRYFRFLARYAHHPPDAATRAALVAGVPGLATLSAERVWGELKRILAAPDPTGAVRLMGELGVLAAVLPEAIGKNGPGAKGANGPGVKGMDALAALVEAGAPADPLTRLAALVSGDLAPLADRLRLSTTEAERLARLSGAGLALREQSSEIDIRRALADSDRATLLDRAWLYGASPALRARIAATPAPVFPLQGRDLLAHGFLPGPELGVRLRALRQHWLDGGCVDTAEALLETLAARGPA